MISRTHKLTVWDLVGPTLFALFLLAMTGLVFLTAPSAPPSPASPTTTTGEEVAMPVNRPAVHFDRDLKDVFRWANLMGMSSVDVNDFRNGYENAEVVTYVRNKQGFFEKKKG